MGLFDRGRHQTRFNYPRRNPQVSSLPSFHQTIFAHFVLQYIPFDTFSFGIFLFNIFSIDSMTAHHRISRRVKVLPTYYMVSMCHSHYFWTALSIY